MRALLLFCVLLWTTLSACTSRPGNSAQCRFNNECATNLVCAGGECRKACNDNRDCPDGVCSPSELPGTTVCISASEPPQCLYNSDCPMARDVCSASRRCVLGCATDYDCRVMDPRTSCDATTHECFRDCALGAVTCVPNAQCQRAGRDAVCVCLRGYTGPNCTACAAGYQDNDGNGTCEFTCLASGLTCTMPTVCSDITGTAQCRLPNDCEDFRRLGMTMDGDQTLYANDMMSRAWTAYCANMATGPAKTYLTLVTPLANMNYGEAVPGGIFVGTAIRTTYRRVRIDGKTLRVDVTDNTFATTTGGPLQHQTAGINLDYVHYASTTACGGVTAMPRGTGNVNLQGTPFQVLSNLRPNTPLGQGNVSYTDLNRVADFSANGSCGEIQPNECFGGISPVNQTSNPVFCLLLQWVGP